MAFIYSLADPRKPETIRYIGKANDPAKRLQSHIRDSRRRRTPLYWWINKLIGEGVLPIISVITECEDWQTEEKRLIAQYRSPELLNLAEGGDEPHCPIEVRRENARKVAKAIAADPLRKRIREMKATISSGIRHGYLTEETRERLYQKLLQRGIV